MRKYIDIINESHSMATIHDLNVEEFVRGYVEAMLFSSSDESNEAGGDPLNKNYTIDDVDPTAMDRIISDCRSFLHSAGPWLTHDRYKGAMVGSLEAHAGHDFWLTRVGHGSGFWDGDWEGEAHGHFDGPLTKRAKDMGHLDPYIGDDGKIHLS